MAAEFGQDLVAKNQKLTEENEELTRENNILKQSESETSYHNRYLEDNLYGLSESENDKLNQLKLSNEELKNEIQEMETEHNRIIGEKL